MTKRIVMLIGVPAAGKSTWIEKEFQGDCHVVSTDNIIQAVADDEGKTYNEVFLTFSKATESMMWSDFDIYVSGGYDPIVIDRTNVSPKSRRRFFERLRIFHKGHGYTVEAVVFNAPETTEWRRRLDSRPGKTIPENILMSMLASFQVPSESEGFSKITYIENNG